MDRSIRRRARDECRKDPLLAAEHRRRSRPLNRMQVPGYIVLVLFRASVLSALLAYGTGGFTTSNGLASLIGLWWLAVVLLGGQIVQTTLRDVPTQLLFHPFSRQDEQVYVTHKVTRLLVGPTFDAILVVVMLALLLPGFEVSLPLALGLSLLYAAMTWSSSLWLSVLRLRPAISLSPIWAGISIFALILVTGDELILLRWLDAYGDVLTTILPGAWIADALLSDGQQAFRGHAAALLVASCLALSGSLALRRSMKTRAWSDDRLADSVPSSVTPSEDDVDPPVGTSELDPLSAKSWNRPLERTARMGWIEALFVRLLTPRETTVAAFMSSSVPRWTSLLWKGALLLLAGTTCIGVSGLGAFERSGLLTVGVILTVMALVFMTPAFSGFDRTFRQFGTYGTSVALQALIPVRLREIARVTAKASLIRFAASAPLLAAAGSVIAMTAGSTALHGFWLGAKVAVLAALAPPWTIVLACASVSDESSRSSLRAVAVIVLLIANSVLLFGLMLLAFLAPPPWDLLFALLVAGSSLGGFRLYERAYSRGWFDLLRKFGD